MKKKTKKTFKKLFALVMVLALLVANYSPFLPIIKAKADPVYESDHTMTFRLDNASVSGNVITFTEQDRSVTATVTGTYTFEQTGPNPELKFKFEDMNNLKITFATKEGISVDVNNQSIPINGDNELVLADIDWSNDDAPHLQVSIADPNTPTDCTPGVDCPGDHPGDNPGGYDDTSISAGKNAEATLNYSVNGIIEYTSGGGFDNGITFSINGTRYRMPGDDDDKIEFTYGPAYERDGQGNIIENENGDPIPILDPETMQQMQEKQGYEITGDIIHYNYDHETDAPTVDFAFSMAPGTLMTGLTINGVQYDLPDTAEELEACYVDHNIVVHIDGVAVADTYNIEIEARYPNADEEFLGNFLWDYNPKGYTGPDDKVLNATVTFVQAKYDGHTYTTVDEINALGGVWIWRDAQRKKTYSNDPELRDGVGEAQFPKGTELTVKIIPDAGYQLVDFAVNDRVFETEDEIGTYTFTVSGGPFHLRATIAQVDDVVKTTAEKIKSGSITLGGEEETMSIGTARLDVDDVELSKDQISNFEDAAVGYEISNYIDISLYNTVFKGSENASWDTEVKDLDNEATITLKLEDGVDGNEVVIVHEKHDGTYEIIPVTYDADAHTVTFKTKSFSNYAIASKIVSEEKKNEKNAKTYDGIKMWVSLFSISGVGLATIAVKRKKLIKNN